MAELTQSIGLLIRRIRSAANDNELSLTEASVLSRLEKHGPATTAELARAESMKPQSMRTTIAALEETGLVYRRPHPTDGRQMNIEIAPQGIALRKKMREAKRTWLAEAILQLDERERETLFAAGNIIRRLVETGS